MYARVERYAQEMTLLLEEYAESISPVLFYDLLGVPLTPELRERTLEELYLDFETMQTATHWPGIVRGQVHGILWHVNGIPLYTSRQVSAEQIAKAYQQKITGQVPV